MEDDGGSHEGGDIGSSKHDGGGHVNSRRLTQQECQTQNDARGKRKTLGEGTRSSRQHPQRKKELHHAT